MNLREPYKGYVVEACPLERDGRWVAAVTIEMHEGHRVHFQAVSDDPSATHGSREEAERASLEFGKELLDSRPTS
jgi:hypothetical protein